MTDEAEMQVKMHGGKQLHAHTHAMYRQLQQKGKEGKEYTSQFACNQLLCLH
jgi:hypothetical protein